MKVAPYFPGFLIAIEGIDGAGKTTQAHALKERLVAQGLRAVYAKEPTTGKWGKLLRESAETGRLYIEEEVELFLKDRREHVSEFLLPQLRDGVIVIVDRYYFSMAAYQGARGLDPEQLLRQNEEFAPEPDLLVLMDLAVETGLGRVRARGDRANLFEQTDALQKAREIFLSIQRPYLLRIDAGKDRAQVVDELLAGFVARYLRNMHQSGLASEEKIRAVENLLRRPAP